MNLQTLHTVAGEPTIGQRIWYSLTEDMSEIHENIFTMIRHAATLYSFLSQHATYSNYAIYIYYVSVQ